MGGVGEVDAAEWHWAQMANTIGALRGLREEVETMVGEVDNKVFIAEEKREERERKKDNKKLEDG